MIFGEANGKLTYANEEFSLASLQIYDRMVTHVFQMPHRDVLLTVGDGVDPRSEEVALRSARVAAAGTARAQGMETWEIEPYFPPPGDGKSILKVCAPLPPLRLVVRPANSPAHFQIFDRSGYLVGGMNRRC